MVEILNETNPDLVIITDDLKLEVLETGVNME